MADHRRVTWGQAQMISQDTWPLLREALKQDTHTGLLCILVSVTAPSHKKSPIHEDLGLHVLDPNLVAGVRNVSFPGASTRRMRTEFIV